MNHVVIWARCFEAKADNSVRLDGLTVLEFPKFKELEQVAVRASRVRSDEHTHRPAARMFLRLRQALERGDRPLCRADLEVMKRPLARRHLPTGRQMTGRKIKMNGLTRSASPTKRN